jgi:hypothetical protein
VLPVGETAVKMQGSRLRYRSTNWPARAPHHPRHHLARLSCASRSHPPCPYEKVAEPARSKGLRSLTEPFRASTGAGSASSGGGRIRNLDSSRHDLFDAPGRFDAAPLVSPCRKLCGRWDAWFPEINSGAAGGTPARQSLIWSRRTDSNR